MADDLNRVETDRAGALALLKGCGTSVAEAATYIALADRDGRASAGPDLAVVAAEEAGRYVVFWKDDPEPYSQAAVDRMRDRWADHQPAAGRD